MSENNLKRLYREQGQAPWLDNISRGLITSGELQKLIDEDGIVGVTSNPTIFEKAIGSGPDYDEQMRGAFASGKDAKGVFFELMLQDIGDAADHFRPVYDRTKHLDGYISIEVTPDLARDTQKTLDQVRWFGEQLKRPNILVKIPATEEGIPAIEQAIYEGISINVTLIFAIERYKQVIEAYIRGLERRVAEGKPVDDVWSVASFFVSRFDTKVDNKLDALIEQAGSDDEKSKIAALKGKGAIANAKIAYELFQQTFSGPRWEKLAAAGAHLQRPLFASTSTKNPSYPDTLYVEALIGPDTVDTMPDATIVAFLDHGTVKRTVDEDVPGAHKVIEDLTTVGISMPQVMKELEDEGVASFGKSYETLTETIESKQGALAAGQDQNEDTDLGPYKPDVEKTLAGLADAAQHLWNKDGAWWSDDKDVQAKVVDRLGWLNVVDTILADADNLRAFAEEVSQAGFKNVLLMGMGGSSLAPDLFSMEFETADGFPELYVLDSTDPSVVTLCRQELDPTQTLYIVSSKSGTTTEPNVFMDYFYDLVREAVGDSAGESFVAITDPGSPLVAEAKKRGFRRVFENPPDIGGRYSALSYFGLVPAALMGVDVRKLLERAHLMAQRCGAGVPAKENPGVWLGAALGTLALAGRDKVTFVTTIGTDSFGDWAEQLIAESTGKQGKGLVPISGEEVGPPEVYGDDRVFIYMPKDGDEQDDLDEAITRLMEAGRPVITLPLKDEYDIGGEFFRWETAIAIAGKVLGINPFDEPNVTESKNNTKRLLEGYAKDHRLPEEKPTAREGAVEIFAYNFSAVTEGPGKNGAEQSDTLSAYVAGLLESVKPGDYVALLAYLSDETMDQLEMIRHQIRDELRVATTLGFGPRFLHSTGQLHKGGPNTGVFLVFTSDEGTDVQIPEVGYSFGTLIRAQALGDIEALVTKGRRVLRLHLVNPEEGMEQVCDLVDEALGPVEIEG